MALTEFAVLRAKIRGQLVKRGPLLVAFSLLASTAIGDPEGARVLWRHAAAGPEGLDQIMAEVWHPVVAFADKEECERMAVQLAPSGLIREYRAMPSGERGEMVTILHCFPEKRK